MMNKIVLITKALCSDCDSIKNEFDLDSLGVTVLELSSDKVEALSLLAWMGVVDEAGDGLPILIVNDNTVFNNMRQIRDYLIIMSSEYGC